MPRPGRVCPPNGPCMSVRATMTVSIRPSAEPSGAAPRGASGWHGRRRRGPARRGPVRDGPLRRAGRLIVISSGLGMRPRLGCGAPGSILWLVSPAPPWKSAAWRRSRAGRHGRESVGSTAIGASRVESAGCTFAAPEYARLCRLLRPLAQSGSSMGGGNPIRTAAWPPRRRAAGERSGET